MLKLFKGNYEKNNISHLIVVNSNKEKHLFNSKAIQITYFY